MKDWLTYAAYRLGAAVVGMFPEPVMRRLGTFAGWLSWMWAGERKLMAIRHMERVLGPGADHRRAARGMFSAYGRYWAETFWFRPERWAQVQRRVSYTGEEHLTTARTAGRPIVVALPHVGNWEMAATVAGEFEVRVTAVAEALSNQRVLDWFIEMRQSLEIDVLIAQNGPATMRGMLRALRAGQLVALVSDRDLGRSGPEVEFFGEVTTLPGGPAALALRTDAALLPVAVYFKESGGHHVVVEPELEVPKDGTRDEKVAAMTQELAYAFERLVRRHPTQWHLVQPNWPSDRAFLEELA